MTGLGPELLGPEVREALAEAVDRFMADHFPPPPGPLPAIDRPLASWVKLLPPRDEPRLAEVRLSQQAYDLLRLACPTVNDRPVSAFDTIFGIPVILSESFPPGWWEMRDQHGQVMRWGFLETPEALIGLVASSPRLR
jgi:hypothetical protein